MLLPSSCVCVCTSFIATQSPLRSHKSSSTTLFFFLLWKITTFSCVFLPCGSFRTTALATKSVKWLWLDLLLSTNSKMRHSCFRGYYLISLLDMGWKIKLMDEIFTPWGTNYWCWVANLQNKIVYVLTQIWTRSEPPICTLVALETASPDSVFLYFSLPKQHIHPSFSWFLKHSGGVKKASPQIHQSNQYAL